MLDIVTVTRKFQVTITKDVREKMKIKEGENRIRGEGWKNSDQKSLILEGILSSH